MIRAGSTAAAFSLRQRLREDWQELLLPAFERAFDQAAGEDEVLRIPKVELRLNVAFEEHATEPLPALIQQQLAVHLRELLREHPGRNEKPAAWRKSTPEQNRLEILLHYLRTGSASWEAPGGSASGLAAELKETCREQCPGLLRILGSEQAPASFYFRWLQLVPAAAAGQLAQTLAESIPRAWKAPLQETLFRVLEPEQKHFNRHSQLQLAALWLSEALARRESAATPDFVPITRSALPRESEALEDFVSTLSISAAALFQPGRSSGAPGKPASTAADAPGPDVTVEISGLPAALSGAPVSPEVPDGVQPKAGASRRAFPAAQSSVPRPEVALPINAGPSPLADQAAQRSAANPKGADEFPLTVTHAGLILLHPFLPLLLESTGIKQTVSPQLSPFVLPRAAALLHFLATAGQEILEYDLAFIKVLLGLRPESPLCVADGLLSDSDKAEAETLLRAAIGHWTALKSSSPGAFRSSFLSRSALLRDTDTGWTLQVERQAFDVLLDHLPWSISVVKLPWMPRLLYTEW